MFHNKRNSRIVYFTDQIYQNVYFTDRSDFTKNACISEKKNDINFKFGMMIDINDSICFIVTKFTDRVFYRPDLRKYPFYRPVCKIHTCQVIFSLQNSHPCLFCPNKMLFQIWSQKDFWIKSYEGSLKYWLCSVKYTRDTNLNLNFANDPLFLVSTFGHKLKILLNKYREVQLYKFEAFTSETKENTYSCKPRWAC